MGEYKSKQIQKTIDYMRLFGIFAPSPSETLWSGQLVLDHPIPS